MLLTEKKKGVSQNGQTPSIIGIFSYCVLDIGQYLSDVKHCSIQSWPRGGLSSWPMVPTTRNLTAPPTPMLEKGVPGKSELMEQHYGYVQLITQVFCFF